MRCWVCGTAADAVCRFCGRGVCKEHARTRAFLFDTWQTPSGLKGLAVDDAIHCGVCRPHPDPVELDFLA